MTDRRDVAIASALLLQIEGCRLAPYLDSAGVPTIGIGCTRLADGSPVTMHTPPLADQDAALDLMTVILAGSVQTVRDATQVALNDNQWAPLYTFEFNVGPSAYRGSTLLHFVRNQRDPEDISAQFMRWVYARDPHTHHEVRVPGLVNRRLAESQCYLGRKVPAVLSAA